MSLAKPYTLIQIERRHIHMQYTLFNDIRSSKVNEMLYEQVHHLWREGRKPVSKNMGDQELEVGSFGNRRGDEHVINIATVKPIQAICCKTYCDDSACHVDCMCACCLNGVLCVYVLKSD